MLQIWTNWGSDKARGSRRCVALCRHKSRRVLLFVNLFINPKPRSRPAPKGKADSASAAVWCAWRSSNKPISFIAVKQNVGKRAPCEETIRGGAPIWILRRNDVRGPDKSGTLTVSLLQRFWVGCNKKNVCCYMFIFLLICLWSDPTRPLKKILFLWVFIYYY